MTREEQIQYCIQFLLKEMPAYASQAKAFPKAAEYQRQLLRSLMNVRMPSPLDPAFIKVQDELLKEEAQAKGIQKITELEPIKGTQIYLWRGDITALACDAIVNAANDQLLGCFVPCHGCIDNAIHSAAGLQLREECSQIMKAQGYPEPAGKAKITQGYNLPARYVIHTVGPIVSYQVSEKDRQDLQRCYRSCLELAAEKGLHSIAFCCISTGEFHFPNEEAAQIAVHTAEEYLTAEKSEMKVIFDVYKETDERIYRRLLSAD